jgi:hypothetical protein
MTREQVMQLAGKLWDAMQGSAPAGTGDGRAPKWDTLLPAGAGQIVWASECSAKELQYQIAKASKPGDPKWAEANAKRVKALGYWLSYRQSSPTECWTGERNRKTVAAKPPSDRPEKYPREAAPVEQSFASDAAADTDDIPF